MHSAFTYALQAILSDKKKEYEKKANEYLTHVYSLKKT